MKLIEKMAQQMAEQTNGGSWNDQKCYTAAHKDAFRKRARIALSVFKDGFHQVAGDAVIVMSTAYEAGNESAGSMSNTVIAVVDAALME